MMIGYGVLTIGAACLSAGLTFKIISAKRLQWVEEEASRKLNQNVSMNIGATRYGLGVTMKF